MKAGNWLVCLSGLVLLAMTSQGCKYTWVPKTELKDLKEAQRLNETQAGYLGGYKDENA